MLIQQCDRSSDPNAAVADLPNGIRTVGFRKMVSRLVDAQYRIWQNPGKFPNPGRLPLIGNFGLTHDTEHDPWLNRLNGPPDQRDPAIAELRDLLVRGLSRALAHRYGGISVIEDVAQQAIMKILESLDKFEGRSKFTTWAMSIAIRIGISELRRKRYKDVSLDAITERESGKIDIAIDPQISPVVGMQQESVLQTLQALIDTDLTEKQKLAIRALLEGLPVEEIAARTHSNRNAIYQLVHDARMRLREGLERAGITAEDINAIFA